MDSNLQAMSKAYAVVRQAMFLCGWHHLYHKVTLSTDEIGILLYYSNMANKRGLPLCYVVRGILFNKLPELYQSLK